MHEATTCKNCGNIFSGKYCNLCGEKIYNEHDKKISHILEESVHFLTHFEGSFFTTLKTFFKSPGKLSLDYCSGIRKKYFKPIPFFLMLVALYFLFPRFEGLNMRANIYANKKSSFAWISDPVFKWKMKKENREYAEIADQYDKKSPKLSKILLLLFIPLSASVLMLLFINKRRLAFDHFVLASELVSFVILSQFLLLPLVSWVVERTAPEYSYVFQDGSWVWWTMFFLFSVFTAVAFRHFYREKRWLSGIKALLFLILFTTFIKYTYSVIVFLVTMLFV